MNEQLFTGVYVSIKQPENVVCKHMKKIKKIIIRNIEHRISLGATSAGHQPTGQQNGRTGGGAEEDEDSDGEDMVRDFDLLTWSRNR